MADFEYSHVVCNCRHVTLGEIVCAIKDNNAQTIEDIGKITDAGTACGCCKSLEDDFGNPKIELHLAEILNRLVS